jgi:hypothetical protein
MSSNDNNKAINSAASVWHTRWGVTLPVGTATGEETPLNNPNRPSTRTSKKLMVHGDATTAKVTNTTHRKKGYSCTYALRTGKLNIDAAQGTSRGQNAAECHY